MKITIKNYKNIINFNLEITDQKLNIIYGLSGTEMSTLIETDTFIFNRRPVIQR